MNTIECTDPEGVCGFPLEAPVGGASSSTLDADLPNLICLTHYGRTNDLHDNDTSWGREKTSELQTHAKQLVVPFGMVYRIAPYFRGVNISRIGLPQTFRGNNFHGFILLATPIRTPQTASSQTRFLQYTCRSRSVATQSSCKCTKECKGHAGSIGLKNREKESAGYMSTCLQALLAPRLAESVK